MPEVDLSKKRYWYLDDIIKFGKYKGEDHTVAKLIKLEPSYLIWLDDNVDWFNLDDDARIKAEEAAEKEKETKRNSRRSGHRNQPAPPPLTVDRLSESEKDHYYGNSHVQDDDEIPF